MHEFAKLQPAVELERALDGGLGLRARGPVGVSDGGTHARFTARRAKELQDCKQVVSAAFAQRAAIAASGAPRNLLPVRGHCVVQRQ